MSGLGERGAAGFHVTQSYRRRSSAILLFGTFAVVAVVVNVVLVAFGAHTSFSCTGPGPCTTRLAPDVLTLGASLVGVAVYLMFAFWVATRSAIKLTGAHPATGPDTAEVRGILEGVSIAAGITPPKLYVIDDPAPNAFAAGTRPGNAIVAVTTGLIATMSRRELEGVIAHEVGHIVNKDTRVMTFAVVAAGAVAVIADVLLRVALYMRGGRDSAQVRLVLFALAIGVYVLAYPLMLVMKASLSRQREVLADATAVQLTRNPVGIRSALEKLEANPTVVSKTTSATAHLWIECPLSTSGSAGFVRRIMSTHPPLADRIARLRQYEGLDVDQRGPNDPLPPPRFTSPLGTAPGPWLPPITASGDLGFPANAPLPPPGS
jgi:heat shock protein HtpX